MQVSPISVSGQLMRLSYSPQTLVGACRQAACSGPFQLPRQMPPAAQVHPLRSPPQRRLAPIHRPRPALALAKEDDRSPQDIECAPSEP